MSNTGAIVKVLAELLPQSTSTAIERGLRLLGLAPRPKPRPIPIRVEQPTRRRR